MFASTSQVISAEEITSVWRHAMPYCVMSGCVMLFRLKEIFYVVSLHFVSCVISGCKRPKLPHVMCHSMLHLTHVVFFQGASDLSYSMSCVTPCYIPRSGELRTQTLKSHLVRKHILNVLPLKPGVGQYIAIHATLTARNFFPAHFYPSSPFTCIFSETLPIFFLR